MKPVFKNLSADELSLFKKLSTPKKIQDFLDTIAVNHEPDGDTCKSPRRVLRERSAHCIEASMLAAAILYFHGATPLLMDLQAAKDDFDHVVALFKSGNRLGAITKSNHSTLRWREPIFISPRELAMSYFHEYFMDNGKRTLRAFSKPFDLSRYDNDNWITDEENLWHIPIDLDESPHTKILTPSQIRALRLADPIEIETNTVIEWKDGKRVI